MHTYLSHLSGVDPWLEVCRGKFPSQTYPGSRAPRWVLSDLLKIPWFLCSLWLGLVVRVGVLASESADAWLGIGHYTSWLFPWKKGCAEGAGNNLRRFVLSERGRTQGLWWYLGQRQAWCYGVSRGIRMRETKFHHLCCYHSTLLKCGGDNEVLYWPSWEHQCPGS